MGSEESEMNRRSRTDDRHYEGRITMRPKSTRALSLAGIIGLLLTLGTADVAVAHGERAQEGFLRMKTVAWQDVRFSSSEVKQGEPLVITGRVKVMEVWPATLE